jgi:hypothetical protein
MAPSSETKYVDDARTVVGYGDTKDLALNDLLEKLKAHESEIRCDCSKGSEYSYWRKSGSACGALAHWNSSAPVLLESEAEITVRTATEQS